MISLREPFQELLINFYTCLLTCLGEMNPAKSMLAAAQDLISFKAVNHTVITLSSHIFSRKHFGSKLDGN